MHAARSASVFKIEMKCLLDTLIQENLLKIMKITVSGVTHPIFLLEKSHWLGGSLKEWLYAVMSHKLSQRLVIARDVSSPSPLNIDGMLDLICMVFLNREQLITMVTYSIRRRFYPNRHRG